MSEKVKSYRFGGRLTLEPRAAPVRVLDRFKHPDGSFENENENLNETEEQEMTVEEFKKKYPHIYQMWHEEGHKIGVAEGLAMVEAEAKAAAAEMEKRRGEAEAKLFENLVAKFRKEGVSLGAAIVKAATYDQKSHADYLARVQAGTAGPLR